MIISPAQSVPTPTNTSQVSTHECKLLDRTNVSFMLEYETDDTGKKLVSTICTNINDIIDDKPSTINVVNPNYIGKRNKVSGFFVSITTDKDFNIIDVITSRNGIDKYSILVSIFDKIASNPKYEDKIEYKTIITRIANKLSIPLDCDIKNYSSLAACMVLNKIDGKNSNIIATGCGLPKSGMCKCFASVGQSIDYYDPMIHDEMCSIAKPFDYKSSGKYANDPIIKDIVTSLMKTGFTPSNTLVKIAYDAKTSANSKLSELDKKLADSSNELKTKKSQTRMLQIFVVTFLILIILVLDYSNFINPSSPVNVFH